ncbi:hypothetical protein G3446_26375 [Thiorhodococcus minor]|uniref:Urate oxidase N-terminal domain-containing protein n=2 Tax=Thiorhodococcus minor TaxID=57489 RepID=A0A6M0K6C6_9GAMM|nr:hypothetical protein [Thiorhodococcus minor]
MIVNLFSGHGLLELNDLALLRWAHIVAGIIWVGLLYFFNFVQMPAIAAATADQGGPGPAAIGKYILPRALLWFRWAALATWLTGGWYLVRTDQLLAAFTLGLSRGGDTAYGLPMGIGVWLGTILLINVWLVLWPNQKKVMGMVKTEGETDLARARKTIATVARINAVLSIPMLMFMVAAGHGVAL